MSDTDKIIKDLENKLKFTKDQLTRGSIVAEIEKIRMSAKSKTPVAELKKIVTAPVVKAEEVNKNGTSISKEVLEKTNEAVQEHNRGIVFANSSATLVEEDNGEVFKEDLSSVEDNSNNNSNNNNKKKRH